MRAGLIQPQVGGPGQIESPHPCRERLIECTFVDNPYGRGSAASTARPAVNCAIQAVSAQFVERPLQTPAGVVLAQQRCDGVLRRTPFAPAPLPVKALLPQVVRDLQVSAQEAARDATHTTRLYQFCCCSVSSFRGTRMTEHRRLARVLHAAIWLAVTCAPAPALAQPESKMPRVRTESQPVRDAVAWGLGESATFRALHEALDATDGLLYIDEGTCRQVGMRACLYLSVQVSGAFRLLRMKVSPRRAPGCALTESIGHELKHVLEVLALPTCAAVPTCSSSSSASAPGASAPSRRRRRSTPVNPSTTKHAGTTRVS